MSQIVAPKAPQAMAVLDLSGQPRLRVRDLEFTDLYVNQAGMAEIQGSGFGPLIQVPLEYVVDLGDLMVKAFTKSETSQDFQLVHDGVTYRGSSIDNQNQYDGRTVVLRRLRDFVPRLASLNLPVPLMRAIGYVGNKEKGRGKGLILVAGDTGSGKTTTICSILQEYLIKYGYVARTIEDPPEYPLERAYPPYGRCYQTKVIDGDFNTPMIRLLRQAPRYVLFGEIRDASAAKDLLRMAQTGHLVLTTIHASTVEDALESLVLLLTDVLSKEHAQRLLASSIAAVIHQRLATQQKADGKVQRIPVCKTLFFPTPDGGANSLVRGGAFHNLKNEIDVQERRMSNQCMPFDEIGE